MRSPAPSRAGSLACEARHARRLQVEEKAVKTPASQRRASSPTPTARANSQEDLLQLVAPGRVPRLRPYSHAAVARLRQLRRTVNLGLLVAEPERQRQRCPA
jgi:hypothetical protein